MHSFCFITKTVPGAYIKNLKMFSAGIMIMLLLNACGTVETVPQNEIKSRYANQTPEQALQLTATRYDEAVKETYDYYSPQNWKLATDALGQARQLSKQNKNNKEIFKQIIIVDRRIDSAKYIRNYVFTSMRQLRRFTLK